jgi:tRNA threonylcarbamoyl adenosine modification protein (Sua5/YciO/YrdC/YwlC family)
MSARYDCTVPVERAAGISEAAAALSKGELAVLPTDTVYGVGADAFIPVAVSALISARGGGRHAPPSVLVGSRRAAFALVEDVSSSASDLIDEFWPGALTLVFRSSRSLVWDLGDTKGTVAVRMPLHPVALDLLKETGPLAVSSANVTGSSPPMTVDEAESQLGDAVSVYLDSGRCPGDVASTIVDVTGPVPRLLRKGAISVGRLRNVVALMVDDEDEDDDGYEGDEDYEDEGDDEDEDEGDDDGGDDDGGDDDGGDDEDEGDDDGGDDDEGDDDEGDGEGDEDGDDDEGGEDGEDEERT